LKSEKSGIMLDHILEEPVLVEKMIEDKERISHEFVELFKKHNIKRIYLSGTGSPYNVCLALKYAAVKILGVEASCSLPSLFVYHEGFNVNGCYKPDEQLLICPAESGRTKGSVNDARHAHDLGVLTACTTLYPDGILGKICDVTIQKPSGLEVALPSTKGHVMGLFIFLLCFIEAAHATNRIDDKKYDEYVGGLKELPQSIYSAYNSSIKWFSDHQDVVMRSSTYRFVGYGTNYATAREGSLKFTESHERPTMFYELEDFMHGPLHAVKNGDVIFFIAAEDGPEKERMFKLVDFARGNFTENCVLIQSNRDEYTTPLSLCFDAVNMDPISAIEYVVPIQVLSYEIADHLGFDLTQWGPISVGKTMGTSYEDG